MIRRSMILSAIVILFLGQTVADDSPAPAAGDADSTWVTSIAPLGSSSQFVASTATGLLLRESSIYSFDASNPSQFTPLYQHPAAAWRVDATSDGAIIASVDYRGNLIVFDTAAAKPTMHEKAFERWCQAMIISPDDKSIIAGNEAGKVMVWDLETGKIGKSAELDGHAVTGLAVSPDGSQLAASDGGGHVHLFKWPSLEAVGKIEVSGEAAWCVAYVDGGIHLLVGSSDRNLYRCEAKAEAKAESVAKGTDWITQLAVSPGGQIAAAEVGGRLHFPSTGGTDSMHAESGVWALCWNGDSQLFAGTRKNGIVMAGRSWKWTEPAPPPKAEAAVTEKPKQENKEDDKQDNAEPPKDEAKNEEAKKEQPEPDSASKDDATAEQAPKPDKQDETPKGDGKKDGESKDD